MKIAVIGTRGFPGVQGGIEKHCEELYPRLASLGVKVTVYARKGYVEEATEGYRGVEIVPLWAPRKKGFEAIAHTFRALFAIVLSRRVYDILHIHAIGPSLALPLARLFGFRVVVTNHGPDYNRKKWGVAAKAVLKLGESFGTRYADSVIAVSRNIQQDLSKRFAREINYIPNGVTPAEGSAGNGVISGYGLDSGRYILAVGRLVPEKGFNDLIEAFRGIETDWKLVIAGGADHEDDYSRKLRKLAKKDPRVIMTGNLKSDRLSEIYSNAGLFVLPSYHEGLPIVLLESMSYGLAFLASDIPANRELVKDDRYIFAPGNVESIREKIKGLIDDRGGMGKAIKEVKDRIKTEFNWDNIAQSTLQVYLRLLEPDAEKVAVLNTGDR